MLSPIPTLRALLCPDGAVNPQNETKGPKKKNKTYAIKSQEGECSPPCQSSLAHQQGSGGRWEGIQDSSSQYTTLGLSERVLAPAMANVCCVTLSKLLLCSGSLFYTRMGLTQGVLPSS